MRLMNRFYSLLALLVVGSASLQAQSDPFPDRTIPALKYQMSMTCTSQVVMNGAIVTDAVVAAYCGDDFRGKESVGAGTNPDIAFLTIWGDDTGDRQYLHFRVFTQGKIFTCNPDPALVYTFNGNVGSTSNPYIIDITPVSLSNNADNSATLMTWEDKTCDVELTGRTLYKDGDWNTLCLPFDIASFDGTPLEEATVKTLTASSFADGILTLTFSDNLNAIEAGKPYLVKWTSGENEVNPVFTGVTISNATANVSTEYVDFIGIYSTVTYAYENRSVLFMGGGSNLYYPDGVTPITINACRAYFMLNGITAGDPASGGDVKGFVLNFGKEDDADGIRLIQNSKFKVQNEGEEWYDLAGRKMVNGKLSNGKLPQGIYIRDGKKILY